MENEPVEHIRLRLRNETAVRLRGRVQKDSVSSGTIAPHNSLQSLCSWTEDKSCNVLNEWPSQSDIVVQQKDPVNMEKSANHNKYSVIQPPEDNISTASLKCHIRKAKGTTAPPNSLQSLSTPTDGTSSNPLLVTTGKIQTSVEPYKLTKDWLFTPLDERDVMTEVTIQEEILKLSEMERAARNSGDEEKANEELELKRREQEKLFELFWNRQKQNRKFQEKWKEQKEEEEEKKFLEEIMKEEAKYQQTVGKSSADRQDVKCHEEENKPLKQRKKKNQETQHRARTETQEHPLATGQHRPATKAKRKQLEKAQVGKVTLAKDPTQWAAEQAEKQRRRKSQRQEMFIREAFLAEGQTRTPGRQSTATRGDRPRRRRNFISRCAARTANAVVFVAV